MNPRFTPLEPEQQALIDARFPGAELLHMWRLNPQTLAFGLVLLFNESVFCVTLVGTEFAVERSAVWHESHTIRG